MKFNYWFQFIKIIIAALSMTVVVAAQNITMPEKEKTMRYLDDTRATLSNEIKRLSDKQLNFKPANGGWSIAEVIEHVALVEGTIENILGTLDQSQVASPNRDLKKLDEIVLREVPDRSKKFQAPSFVSPTGKWTAAAALDQFQSARKHITEILHSKKDLRKNVVEHPVYGFLDGYQWILATAGHSERHTKQIQEIKSDPGFPKK